MTCCPVCKTEGSLRVVRANASVECVAPGCHATLVPSDAALITAAIVTYYIEYSPLPESAGVMPLGAFSPMPGPIPQEVRTVDIHCRRCLTRQTRESVDALSVARHQDEHGVFDSAVCLACGGAQ